MNVGHVQGGTNAGWRIIRPTHEPWFCGCYELVEGDTPGERDAVKKQQRGGTINCLDCGERRPK